jgi:outer membrane receptor protein involved in Fe transport
MVYPTYNFTKVTPGSFTTADYGSAQYVPNAFRNGNQFNTRIDHELRPGKDHLYGNLYRTSTGYMTGGIRTAFNRPENDVSDFGNLNETHLFSPTMLNEVQAGVMRMVGLPEQPRQLAIPSISITSITGFGDSSYPSGWFQTEIHAKDTFTWIRSAHTVKIGGGVLRVLDDSRNTTSFMPVYTFANLLNFTLDTPLQETREVDPANGNPASNNVLLKLWESNVFVADDWKVLPNFTLNLGLRYENFGSPSDPGSLRNLVWGLGSNYAERLASASVNIVNKWYSAGNRNFAPRFGFAWNPGGKGRMAIRGGMGSFLTVSHSRRYCRSEPTLLCVRMLPWAQPTGHHLSTAWVIVPSRFWAFQSIHRCALGLMVITAFRGCASR